MSRRGNVAHVEDLSTQMKLIEEADKVVEGKFLVTYDTEHTMKVLERVMFDLRGCYPKEVTAESIKDNALHYCSDKAVLQGISLNEVLGMKVISLAVYDPEDNVFLQNFKENNGKLKNPYVFSWCENLDALQCSEFGDIYVEQRGEHLYRVG